MSSYIDHFLKSSRDLPNIITESLRGIENLDNAVTAISNRLDNDLEKLVEDHIEHILQENKAKNSKKQNNKKNLKRKYVSSPPTASSSSTGGTSSKDEVTTTIDPSLQQMKFLIEDFTDRKSQLSINSYDIIDQHIRVVDEEIKLLETAIRLSGAEVPPVPSSTDMEEMYTNGNGGQKKKKKKKKKKKNTDDEDVDEDEEENSFEPVYCLCQKANYGDMIRCDSDDCSIEWFHYPCVGLTKEPVKRWLCPECMNQSK